ncbi:MAG: aspartate aminotransferase family protein [Rhodospirillales bacterium]|nr:aspartate aminotransferase family protein [Rhodospirillales bacterium]
MDGSRILSQATAHAVAFLKGLAHRDVGATARAGELRDSLERSLPELGTRAEQVLDELVHDVEGGIVASTGPRFFGWVMGGALPVALAADWLTSTWDQNAAVYATSPAEALIEEVTGGWLKELLGLPPQASFAFVTGCQMAHTTALAAARHRLLSDRDWNVETKGQAGAPPLRILTSEDRHASINRAVRLLGLGTDAIEPLSCDEKGRIQLAALEDALQKSPSRPTVLCLQAGELNTGAYDRFRQACTIAHAARAWVHVDGAFGLWAAASEKYRHLTDGVELADSWAADGHKWLNVPYDSGFVFVADPAAHQAVFAEQTGHASPTASGAQDTRNQMDWNPEWSRRGRAVPVYAAIRTLGRSGIAEIVERNCAHATRLVNEIGNLPGAEILAEPIINQGLVRFRAANSDHDGDHDAHTDRVIARIQSDGVAWFGPVTWCGKRAMRISLSNWRTTDADIDLTVASIKAALAHCDWVQGSPPGF